MNEFAVSSTISTLFNVQAMTCLSNLVIVCGFIILPLFVQRISQFDIHFQQLLRDQNADNVPFVQERPEHNTY